MSAQWVRFFFEKWKAGTASMSRLQRSAYFDLCLWFFEHPKDMPERVALAILADLDNPQDMLDQLVALEKLSRHRLKRGTFYRNKFAIDEAKRSQDMSTSKREAGRKGAQSRKSVGNQHKSGSSATANRKHTFRFAGTEREKEYKPLTPSPDGGRGIDQHEENQSTPRANGTNSRRTGKNPRHKREMEDDVRKLCWFCDTEAETQIGMVYHCQDHKRQAREISNRPRKQRPFGARTPDQAPYNPHTLAKEPQDA